MTTLMVLILVLSVTCQSSVAVERVRLQTGDTVLDSSSGVVYVATQDEVTTGWLIWAKVLTGLIISAILIVLLAYTACMINWTTSEQVSADSIEWVDENNTLLGDRGHDFNGHSYDAIKRQIACTANCRKKRIFKFFMIGLMLLPQTEFARAQVSVETRLMVDENILSYGGFISEVSLTPTDTLQVEYKSISVRQIQNSTQWVEGVQSCNKDWSNELVLATFEKGGQNRTLVGKVFCESSQYMMKYLPEIKKIQNQRQKREAVIDRDWSRFFDSGMLVATASHCDIQNAVQGCRSSLCIASGYVADGYRSVCVADQAEVDDLRRAASKTLDLVMTVNNFSVETARQSNLFKLNASIELALGQYRDSVLLYYLEETSVRLQNLIWQMTDYVIADFKNFKDQQSQRMIDACFNKDAWLLNSFLENLNIASGRESYLMTLGRASCNVISDGMSILLTYFGPINFNLKKLHVLTVPDYKVKSQEPGQCYLSEGFTWAVDKDKGKIKSWSKREIDYRSGLSKDQLITVSDDKVLNSKWLSVLSEEQSVVPFSDLESSDWSSCFPFYISVEFSFTLIVSYDGVVRVQGAEYGRGIFVIMHSETSKEVSIQDTIYHTPILKATIRTAVLTYDNESWLRVLSDGMNFSKPVQVDFDYELVSRQKDESIEAAKAQFMVEDNRINAHVQSVQEKGKEIESDLNAYKSRQDTVVSGISTTAATGVAAGSVGIGLSGCLCCVVLLGGIILVSKSMRTFGSSFTYGVLTISIKRVWYDNVLLSKTTMKRVDSRALRILMVLVQKVIWYKMPRWVLVDSEKWLKVVNVNGTLSLNQFGAYAQTELSVKIIFGKKHSYLLVPGGFQVPIEASLQINTSAGKVLEIDPSKPKEFRCKMDGVYLQSGYEFNMLVADKKLVVPGLCTIDFDTNEVDMEDDPQDFGENRRRSDQKRSDRKVDEEQISELKIEGDEVKLCLKGETFKLDNGTIKSKQGDVYNIKKGKVYKGKDQCSLPMLFQPTSRMLHKLKMKKSAKVFPTIATSSFIQSECPRQLFGGSPVNNSIFYEVIRREWPEEHLIKLRSDKDLFGNVLFAKKVLGITARDLQIVLDPQEGVYTLGSKPIKTTGIFEIVGDLREWTKKNCVQIETSANDMHPVARTMRIIVTDQRVWAFIMDGKTTLCHFKHINCVYDEHERVITRSGDYRMAKPRQSRFLLTDGSEKFWFDFKGITSYEKDREMLLSFNILNESSIVVIPEPFKWLQEKIQSGRWTISGDGLDILIDSGRVCHLSLPGYSGNSINPENDSLIDGMGRIWVVQGLSMKCGRASCTLIRSCLSLTERLDDIQNLRLEQAEFRDLEIDDDPVLPDFNI